MQLFYFISFVTAQYPGGSSSANPAPASSAPVSQAPVTAPASPAPDSPAPQSPPSSGAPAGGITTCGDPIYDAIGGPAMGCPLRRAMGGGGGMLGGLRY